MLNNDPSMVGINPERLSHLDKTELLDLLMHKTRLFLAAANSKVVNREYYQNIKREVEIVQTEIKNRMGG